MSNDIPWLEYWLQHAKEQLEYIKKHQKEIETAIQYFKNQMETIKSLHIESMLTDHELKRLQERIKSAEQEFEELDRNREYFRNLVQSLGDPEEIMHQLQQAKKAYLNLKLFLPKDWKPPF